MTDPTFPLLGSLPRMTQTIADAPSPIDPITEATSRDPILTHAAEGRWTTAADALYRLRDHYAAQGEEVLRATRATEAARHDAETANRQLADARAQLARQQREHGEFRRAVVEKAQELLDDETLCNKVWEALEDIGLTEEDGIPPKERTITVKIHSFEVEVIVERGEELETDDVIGAARDWVDDHLGSHDYTEL